MIDDFDAQIRFDFLGFDEHNLFCKTLLQCSALSPFQHVDELCYNKIRERKVIRLRNVIAHTKNMLCFASFIIYFLFIFSCVT